MFKAPDITAIHFGNFEIKFYGILILCALVAGFGAIYLICKNCDEHRAKIDKGFLLDLFPIVVLGGIFGARLYYVLLNWEFYFSHWSEIFAIWHGGISIHGALLGGILAGVIYCKRHKKAILPYADVFSYGLVLGQAIGRWGNFFNSEAFGTPTNLPWKLFIAERFRPNEFYGSEFFHPAFLYESICDLVIFLVLFFVVRKMAKERSGIVFFGYLIMYSTARFFIEMLRTDSVLNISNIPIAQIVSTLVVIVGGLGLLFIKFKEGKC